MAVKCKLYGRGSKNVAHADGAVVEEQIKSMAIVAVVAVVGLL